MTDSNFSLSLITFGIGRDLFLFIEFYFVLLSISYSLYDGLLTIFF